MQLTRRKTGVICQRYLRHEPEFGLAVRVRDVNMDSRFFTGKEEQTKRSISCNGGGHLDTVTAIRAFKPAPALYSTVTDLAKLRGLSTSVPRAQAVWYASSCSGTTCSSGLSAP